MGYCTTDDVMTLLPNADAYSRLTPEQVSAIIDDTANEMDAMMARFYVVPVTGDATALGILKRINKELARAYVAMVYDRSATNKVKPMGWRDLALEMMQRIVPDRAPDGTQPYPTIRLTATLANPTERPIFPAGSIADFNQDDDATLFPEKEPFFRRTDRAPWQGGII